MKTIYIYVLRDPRDNAIRYVGRTYVPDRRLSYHLRETKKPTIVTHKNNWIRSLLAAGVKPTFEPIFCWQENEVNENALAIIEQNWIRELRAVGHNLTNIAVGGQGFDPVRAKLATANIPHEVRKQAGIKANAKLSAEERRARARKSMQTFGIDAIRERSRRASQTLGPEGIKARLANARAKRAKNKQERNGLPVGISVESEGKFSVRLLKSEYGCTPSIGHFFKTVESAVEALDIVRREMPPGTFDEAKFREIRLKLRSPDFGLRSTLPTDLEPMLLSWLEAGLSFRKIAQKLTVEGIPTRLGGEWTASSVKNVVDRLPSRALPRR